MYKTLLLQAFSALQTCKRDGYIDSEGDYRPRDHFDLEVVNSAMVELKKALLVPPPPNLSIEIERKEFEKSAKSVAIPLVRNADGCYVSELTSAAWCCWLDRADFARRALPVQLETFSELNVDPLTHPSYAQGVQAVKTKSTHDSSPLQKVLQTLNSNGFEPVQPVTDKQDAAPVVAQIVAGALFDFIGMLTSQPEKTRFSDCDDAAPAVEQIQKFAAKRGLSLDEADVRGWTKALHMGAQPVQPAATDAETAKLKADAVLLREVLSIAKTAVCEMKQAHEAPNWFSKGKRGADIHFHMWQQKAQTAFSTVPDVKLPPVQPATPL